jgi:hypothetical protein
MKKFLLTISTLLLLSTLLFFVLKDNNIKTTNPIKVENPIVSEPKPSSKVAQEKTILDCAPNQTLKTYILPGNNNISYNYIDSKGKYKDGFNTNNLNEYKNFIIQNGPYTLSEGGHMANLFTFNCGGYASKIIEEYKDMQLKNVNNQRTVITLEGQQGMGTLAYNTFAIKGDYHVWYKVYLNDSSEFNKLKESCITEGMLNQTCFDDKVKNSQFLTLIKNQAKDGLNLLFN